MTPSFLLISPQLPRPTTFVTQTTLLTEAIAETPPKALRLGLLSRIAEIRHNAGKRAKANEQRYKRLHDAQVLKESRFLVGQLLHVACPVLSTSAADEMSVKEYSNLLWLALGSYCITSTTWLAITIDQGGAPDTISVGWESLAPTQIQLQDDIIDDKYM